MRRLLIKTFYMRRTGAKEAVCFFLSILVILIMAETAVHHIYIQHWNEASSWMSRMYVTGGPGAVTGLHSKQEEERPMNLDPPHCTHSTAFHGSRICHPEDFTSHPAVFAEKLTNLEDMPCPPYLHNFRSPCWREVLDATQPYENNPFVKHFNVIRGHGLTEIFGNLTKGWENLRNMGIRYRVRCFPSVHLAGVVKSGTFNLWKYLTLHPDIQAALIKEPHWWSHYFLEKNKQLHEGMYMDNYLDLFDKAALDIQQRLDRDDKCGTAYYRGVIVDGSAWTLTGHYTWWLMPENKGASEPRILSANFIRRLTPHAKIIVILRNPIDRAYAHYQYEFPKGKEPEVFHEHVLNVTKRLELCKRHVPIRGCFYSLGHGYGHMMVSVYYNFLKDWLELFPRGQVHIIHFEEEFAKDMWATLQGITKFLGLDAMPEHLRISVDKETARQMSRQSSKLQMLNKTRQYLDNFYRPYNEKLAKLLNDKRFLWL